MNHLPNRATQKSKVLWPAFIAVILIAFFFRFYRLADHPPAIFFDPAINGLDALRLMQRGGHVLFFPTNGGRESLFIYLLIPFIQLFGTTPFAIRALTATIGLLNVALLFACLYNLQSTRSNTAANNHSLSPIFLPFFAGLTLAAMYWHISVSRLGQRPILVPMLSVPIFWFFLKGWANKQKRWFILSGLLMGLSGYTYSAARLLPVILVVALLPEFFISRQVPQNNLQKPLHNGQRLKKDAINLGLFLLAAGLVYAPMAGYLFNHPAQFTARAGSVMVWNFLHTPTDIITEIGRNTLRVAAFFCCAGSLNPIFGLPGYPGLSPLLAPFLVMGLFATLKNWRGLFHRLVAVWWIVGIAPSIIAIEAPHPLRMIVALPATAILVALGLRQLHMLTSQYLLPTFKIIRKNFSFFTPARRTSVTVIYFSLFTLLLFLPLPFLYRAYFVDWTALKSTRGAYDYGAVAIRNAVVDQGENNVALYLPQSRLNDSTLLYYLSGTFRRQADLSAPPAEKARVISPQKQAADTIWVRLHNGTATILPPLTPEGRQMIQTALSGNLAQPIYMLHSNETAARQAPLPADPAHFTEGIANPANVSFGPMRLVGATWPQTVNPQNKLPVTLFWQANSPMVDEYKILLRLVDDNHQAWGNGDARPTDWVYPTSFWQPGLDQIAAQQSITFTDTLPPPGRYRLAVSVFDAAKGARIPISTPGGNSPDTHFLGPLKVPLAPPSVAQRQKLTSQPATFGLVAQLLGFSLEPAAPTPGETVQLHLLWQAQAVPKMDYTVFVHLLDEKGNLVTGSDSQPVGGRYPTTIWTPGEQIWDTHTLAIPTNPATGETGQYQVAIGLYHQPTGQRLPLILPQGQTETDGRLILSQKIAK